MKLTIIAPEETWVELEEEIEGLSEGIPAITTARAESLSKYVVSFVYFMVQKLREEA